MLVEGKPRTFTLKQNQPDRLHQAECLTASRPAAFEPGSRSRATLVAPAGTRLAPNGSSGTGCQNGSHRPLAFSAFHPARGPYASRRLPPFSLSTRSQRPAGWEMARYGIAACAFAVVDKAGSLRYSSEVSHFQWFVGKVRGFWAGSMAPWPTLQWAWRQSKSCSLARFPL
jgi:hypothetical protein